METVPVAVKEGTYTLYDVEGDCVGRVCTETGRAMIGDAFYFKVRTCRMIDNGCELCCSECDARHEYDDEPNYCRNCGAKVIK